MVKVYVKAEVLKSLKERQEKNKLEYFKKELLKVLEQVEKRENNAISKAIEDYDNSMAKTFIQEFGVEKAGYGIGTIRVWKGEKFRKIAPGKWRKIYDSNTRGARQSVAIIKKKVENAKNIDELMQIVTENTNRFMDADGKLLSIVEELKNVVNENKGRINSYRSEKNETKKELRFENIPKTSYDTEDKEEVLKKVINEINTKEPTNPVLKNVLNLFINNINKLYPDFKLIIVNKGNSCSPTTGELKIDLDRTDDFVKSFVHEWMHMIDYKCGDNAYATMRNEQLQNIIKNTKITDVPNNIQSAIFGDVVPDFRAELLSRIPSFLKISSSSKNYKEAQFKNKMLLFGAEAGKNNEYEADKKRNRNNSALSDIMDALSGGKLYDLKLFSEGHGNEFKAVYNRASEIMSDYASLCFTKPKQVELLKKNYPELCEELDRSLNVYAKKLEEMIYG